MNAGILGIGSYVPDRVVPNAALERATGLSDGWVRERLGIERRRHCDTGEDVTTMAAQALMDACKRAGVAPGEIDALVTSTTTPGRLMPGLGADLIAEVGLDLRMAPVDVVGAGCAGAVGVLQLGESLVRSGAGTVAVVQSEASSALMDFDDIGPSEGLAATIFSDGACCWLLRQCREDTGLLYGSSRTDPAGYEGLALTSQDLHGFTMDAQAVKAFASNRVPALIRDLEAGSGIAVGQADLVLLHQANLRLIENVLSGLDVPMEKSCTTVQDLGNTVSASVGLTAARAVDTGLLVPGATVFLAAFGAGWTTAGSVLRWCGEADFVD
ncbi:3-oxoacyl-ACP synthase III family protein [Kitasatospora sp. NPDC054768]